VEQLLLPNLQVSGVGLHLIEQGVRLWRLFTSDAPSDNSVAAWAAGVAPGYPRTRRRGSRSNTLAALYGVPVEQVADCS